VKEDNSFEEAKEVLTAYLIKKKHRKTPERYALLEKIADYDGHFDAEQLYKAMVEGYRVSLATVYNNLELFLDAGLITRHHFAGQTTQFEKTFGSHTHHHLICTKCGKVKEFTDKKIKTMIQTKEFAKFNATHYSLYLYGICNNCSKEKKQTEKKTKANN
jgi:Fur family ferric uptake transcriptional regulator